MYFPVQAGSLLSCLDASLRWHDKKESTGKAKLSLYRFSSF